MRVFNLQKFKDGPFRPGGPSACIHDSSVIRIIRADGTSYPHNSDLRLGRAPTPALISSFLLGVTDGSVTADTARYKSFAIEITSTYLQV